MRLPFLLLSTAITLNGLALPGSPGGHRQDFSPYGLMDVRSGETLRLTVTATSGGHGCRLQLLFQAASGGSMGRPLSVNLDPGTSGHNDVRIQDDSITAVKPTAWGDPTVPQQDCDLKLTATLADGKAPIEISAPKHCDALACTGEGIDSLHGSRLRIYVFAGGEKPCRAQLGFRLPRGGVSASAKYVTLVGSRGDSLDWESGEDIDLRPHERVVPVVAFHEGDRCIASAEVVSDKAPSEFAPVPLEFYPSPTVGLDVNPASISTTIDALSAQVAKNPRDRWALTSLAQAYDRQGQEQRAINLMVSSLKTAPKSAETWFMVAKLQYNGQDFGNARQSLGRYLQLRPGDPKGLAALGAVLVKLHRFEEAERTLKPLMANPATRTPSTLNSWAELLVAREQYSLALPFVEESQRLLPACKYSLYLRGRVLSGEGRLAESVAAAEQAKLLDPDFLQNRVLLAQLYSSEGKTELAARETDWLRANFGKTRE